MTGIDTDWLVYDQGVQDGISIGMQAAGYTAGHADGYTKARADIDAEDAAQWAIMREHVLAAVGVLGVRARRDVYTTPARTAAQIRAQAAWSWRQAEREIRERHQLVTTG